LDNETIDFPSGVTSVGPNAFKNCISIKSINLENVTTIYEGAFRGCTSIESLDLTNVTSLIDRDQGVLHGNECFASCSSLKSVKVSSKLINTTYYVDYNWFPFSGSALENIDLTDMTKIPAGLFGNCLNLQYIDLSNVDTIYPQAFWIVNGGGINCDNNGYFITKVKCNNEVIKKQLDNWPDLFNRIVTLVYDGVPYIYVKHKDKWLIIRGYNIDDVKDDEAYIPIKDQTIWRYIKLLSEMDTSATPIYIKSNNKWLRISF
jgi:hypothetical protein